MICWHGTTEKGLRAILSGKNHKPNSPWNVSDQDDGMYVWPFDKMANDYGYDPDNVDIDQIEEQGVRMAFESAQVQAIVSGETKLYVLQLDIPDVLLEDDYSCENMEHTASFISLGEFSPTMIVGKYGTEFNVYLKAFVAANLLSNPNFNQCALDPFLLRAAEIIAQGDNYYEEAYEIEWSECDDHRRID